MTIGIAAAGPKAGLAVFRALAAIERVARGAVGGYAVFAAIDAAGGLHRAETQRGGTSTLFVRGEMTGVEPPSSAASARLAALMSSGPDRPEPLSQFLPADPSAGLVTGHRLPNAAGVTGRPVNLEVLDALRRGLDARAAVDAVLDADPDADAGIIAVDVDGNVYARNSARVDRRPDLGHARREDAEAGAVIEVIHNAVFPASSLAALAVDIGFDVMVDAGSVDGEFIVAAGVPLAFSNENSVLLNDEYEAVEIRTNDRRILTGTHNCAAIYLGARVVRGDAVLGATVFEPNAVVSDGRLVSLNGAGRMTIGYRRQRR